MKPIKQILTKPKKKDRKKLDAVTIKNKTALAKIESKSLLNPQGLQEGDFVISRNNEVLKVGKYYPRKEEFDMLYKHDHSEEYSHYGKYELKEGGRDKYIKLEKSVDEYNTDLADYMLNGLPEIEGDVELSTSTEVAVANEKSQTYLMKSRIEEKQRKVMLLERLVDRRKDKLNSLVRKMDDQIKEIKKVITILELYLGVDEDIVQIVEGPKAPIDTPITFRQLVLHMDEEVALDKKYRDMDFRDIDNFDQWMRKNYKVVLPEEKGVVICRPRRSDKHYNDGELEGDSKENNELNVGNFETYVLIRNGSNIYRIATTHNIYPFLFPMQDEMEKLNRVIHDDDFVLKDGRFSHVSEEDAENILMKYKRNVFLLQGLIDRTEVFYPYMDGINLMKPETYGEEGSVFNFVYDGTGIDSGKPKFFDWLEECNSHIKVGSRFFFSGYPRGDAVVGWRTPEIGWYSHDTGHDKMIPHDQRPPEGVYTVDRIEGKEGSDKKIVFKYNPKDEIFTTDYWRKSKGERKRALTFYVYYHDHCILHYDSMKVEDMQYYMNSRLSRQHYLEMLPVLEGIIERKGREEKQEDGFKQLLISQLEIKGDLEKMIDEVITWWKMKCIEKRALTKDDAKALRMIKKEVTKRFKEGVK